MDCSPSQEEPHGALFLVLGYLRLPELFAAQRTCRSLRDAIAGDVLLWVKIRVEPPLSRKLTDGVLLELTSRARGRLKSLSLVSCWKITDAAIRRVAQENPELVKIDVPGCTLLTADTVVEAVTSLIEMRRKTNKRNSNEEMKRNKIFQVGMNGLAGLEAKHLIALRSMPGSEEIDIDADVCPRCNAIRLVFSCTREICRSTSGGQLSCRGCSFCIPRCVECGGCVDDGGEESACAHILCLNCWLRLPKCGICNRPLCSNDHLVSLPDPFSPFTCDQCSDPSPSSLEYELWE